MRPAAIALFTVSLLFCGGCSALEARFDKEGATGSMDCESRCWPAGRVPWTNKCLCEPWVEECRSTKLPICSPCDRKRAREAARDTPETSPDIP